jgi:predicted dehydrogenase
VNLASIGTGWISELFFDAAKRSGRYKAHSVYSRIMEKALDFKEKTGADYATDSLDALISDETDIVYIASPNSLQYEQACFFLNNNKHVICEKPITTQKNQLTELYEIAREKDLFIVEALRHIHSPGFYAIKESLEKIAPIRNVSLSFNQYSSRYDLFKQDEISNVFNPLFGGGAEFDLGIYPLSFAAALFGRPKSFHYAPTKLSNGVCGAGAYLLDYGSFVASIMFSKISDDISHSQILGELGGIRLNTLNLLDEVSLILRGQREIKLPIKKDENPLIHEARAFADIIENKDIEGYRRLCEISMIANRILTEGDL